MAPPLCRKPLSQLDVAEAEVVSKTGVPFLEVGRSENIKLLEIKWWLINGLATSEGLSYLSLPLEGFG